MFCEITKQDIPFIYKEKKSTRSKWCLVKRTFVETLLSSLKKISIDYFLRSFLKGESISPDSTLRTNSAGSISRILLIVWG